MRSEPPPSPPLPNTYWVQPGRLLAGEYPGSMSRAEAMERVRTLLRAGVTSFIDLTEEGEMPEYDPFLPELTERRIRYRRLPVLDHGLPESPAHMAQIVDAIEAELADERCVYVHCRAGIGRTGMAVACCLIRSGFENEDALDHLQTLWRQCARSRRWPSVPETDEQVRFVRQWRDAARQGGSRSASRATSRESRFEGSLIGLAVGEVLGVLAARDGFELASLSGGANANLHSGSQASSAAGAHVAMTRALAESLLACGAHDASDQMAKYLQWTRTAADAPIPADFKRALAAWQWSKKPHAGSHDPRNLDAHSLPRTLAVALFMDADPEAAIAAAAESSRTTQQAPIVLDLCRVWAGELVDALAGVSKDDLRNFSGPAMQQVRQRALKPAVKALLNGRARAHADPGDALGVTSVAMSSFASTETLRDALLHAATAARATPAAAALCGALCGAHYGIDAIPLDWRRLVPEDGALRSLAHRLLT